VTVFAAASLQESLTTLGRKIEKAHPGTKVTFSFRGSDSLAAGITGGDKVSSRTTALRPLAGLTPTHRRPSPSPPGRHRVGPYIPRVAPLRRRVAGLPALSPPHRSGQRRPGPAARGPQGRVPNRGRRVADPRGPRRPRRRQARPPPRRPVPARRPRPRPGDHPRLDARAQLRRHLAEFSGVALLVTHDPLDARAPADRLVVIEEGRVVLEGTASDIARHARTPYGPHRPAGRPQPVQGPGGRPHRPPGRGPAITATEILSGPAFAAFPPSAVTLFRDPPPGSSARNPPISPRSSRPNRPAPDRHGLGDSQGDADMRIPGITPHWGYGGPGHEALNHPPPARRSP